MPVVLAPLVPLALVIILIALAFAIAYIMNTIGDVLRGIPVAGGYLADAAKSIGQAITHAAGFLENQVDHLVGVAWHWMARYLDRTWHQLEAQAHLAWAESVRLADLAYSHLGIKAAVHSIASTARSAWHLAKRLEAWSLRMERRIHKLEHDLTHGIGDDVLPRLKSLDREIGRLEHKTIPAIRAEAGAAEADVASLRKWITQNVPLAATATFAGVVAAALGSLGLGWLRCNNNPFNNNKNACGLWGDLSALLSVAVIAGEVAALSELIGVAQEVTEDVTKIASEVLKV